jgi:predicted GIY-YIG superfamily endonuclease
MATAKPKSEYYKRKMEAQEEKDEEAKCFFVYILKLDDGNFYIGQTRELRERISEHKDNKTDSTAKKNPKLQYFEIVQTREIAIEREKELKAIVKANQREIRRMIITFQDYIKTIEI